MIIRRLRLYNFGVYAGDNEFLFTNNKPIVLIGGMNGRGKTTFWKRFSLLYMDLTLLRIQRVKRDLMRSILNLLLIRTQKTKHVLSS